MSLSYLCDTNVLAEWVRPRPNAGVIAWSSTALTSTVAISVISIEEIFYGLAAKPDPRIETWFHDFVATRGRTLPVTDAIAEMAGRFRGTLRRAGKTRSQSDMLIAATAAVHRLTLVTRNPRDFEGCSIALLDPFTP